ncbi:MAG: replicative DNA helicase, partial [Planctomycetota bacterium]
RAVLGSLLLAMGEAGQVFGRVTPESFYSRRHALIFEQVRGLHEEHGTVDVILLRDRLEREGVLDEVGGLDYLVDLTESVTTSANANHYANLLVDKALLRGLIQTTSEILTDAYDSGLEPGQQIDRAEQRVFELSNRSMEDGTVPLSEAIRSTFDLIDQWHKGGSGLKTGYTDLDKRTNGLQPAELIVVAGRPSMGKTTISMNIAQAIALGLKKSVGIFSLEVDSRAIAMNLLCGTARVPSQKLRGNELGAREWQRLTAAADMLSEAEIYIDDSPNLNTMSIRAKARRLKAQKDIELIVIDYLQLLEFGGGRTESRQQEISAISRSLKAMARELSVPVITISQLSRAVEQREDHRPRMSDLRESGAIEQDADKILLIYRDEYYHPDKEESKGKAEIIVAKNRNGPVGTVELAFIGEYMRFENLANYQEEF